MRINHLEYLSCPQTNNKLKLTSFGAKGNHVTSGVLETGKTWYPIIKGVPRLLVGELRSQLLRANIDFYKKYRPKLPPAVKSEWQSEIKKIVDMDKFLAHQKRTAESFAYEWKTIYKENSYERNNFLHFVSPFVDAKSFKQKVIIDAGCGSGRFTKQAALLGAKIAIGSDLGESAVVAYELTKNIPNVLIVQADIYHMPFIAQADLTMSIGVLHHLPNPEKGFASLKKTVAPNGRLLIWVYSRRHNFRALYLYEPIRSFARHIPKPILLKICYLPAGAVQAINYASKLLKALGADGLAKKLPFSYYVNFPFNMKLNDAFDVLATPKSNYYYSEDVEGWFKRASLKKVNSYEHPEAGITVVGVNGK